MIKAVNDKIVVEYLRKTTSKAGILIPEMAQDPQGYGKVLSVGEKVDQEIIKEGDILVFHTRAGMDLIQNKKVLKCLKYEEIYGVLDDDELVSRLSSLDLNVKEESAIKPIERGGIVIAS